jgi:hypothetical protein
MDTYQPIRWRQLLTKQGENMISDETKARLRELEGQKITLEDELERLSYTNNFVRIAQLEAELFDVKDSIKKITSGHWFEDISRAELQKEEAILQ